MADTTFNFWNNDGKRVEAAPKKRRHGALWFLLVLLLVLCAVFVAAWRDGTGFDALHRYFSYGASAEGTLYRYDVDNSNCFAAVGSRLAVLSGTSLRLLTPDGGEVWSASVQMEHPALAQGGGRAAAYDIGGSTLYLLDENGEALHLETDGTLISATLNPDGMLAVTQQRSGQKGHVSVYSADLQLAFELNSSRRFVTDACVTEDGGRLAAVTLGQEESVFVSSIVLYDLSRTDPVGSYDIQDGLVVEIGALGGTIAAVTDTKLTFADPDGSIAGVYAYPDAYLRECDLSGDDFAALLLNRYKSGSVGRLVTVGTDGSELGALSINEEIRSLSAGGRYLAVLYTDRLVIYNRELQIYSTLHGVEHVQSALVRPDGSALLLSADSAELFLP